MTQQIINVGSTINDGTGEPARTAFTKSNANFTELYAAAWGNVSNNGTPTAGQVAEWVTATTIKGVSTYAKLASPTFTGTVTVDEIALVGILSTTPPASPVDGQLWAFAPTGMTPFGTTWLFRYDSGLAPSPWAFIGGAPMQWGPVGSMSTTSTSPVDLSAGPTLTLARAGDYWVEIEIFAQSLSGGPHNCEAYPFSSSPATDGTHALFVPAALYSGASIKSTSFFAAVNAGTVVNIRCYLNAANNSQFYNALMRITPVRIA